MLVNVKEFAKQKKRQFLKSKPVHTVKSMSLFVFKLFKLATKLVWKFGKFVVFFFSNITAFAIILSILISVYGVATVIIADNLRFTLNPDKMKAGSLSDIDENDFYAKAKALDREKIAQYYEENKVSMQAFFQSIQITNQPNERPAKDIDLFILVNEIYNRPELNSEDYEYPIELACVLGAMKIEATAGALGLGNGSRLTNSEIDFVENSFGYCDPLGNKANLWLSNVDRKSTGGIGCTYISEDEFPALDTEQRSILGGGGNIQNNNASYISYDNLTRQSNQVEMKNTDDSFKYLDTIRLSNDRCSYRGFTTWLADAIYTYAYMDRLTTNGLNRDTHNRSTMYYDSGNIQALREFQSELNLEDEQIGVIASMLYGGDRAFHCSVDALPNYAGIEELNPEVRSTCVAVSTILYLEGYLDGIVEKADNNLMYFKNNYTITEDIYGPVDTSGTAKITSLNPDGAYMLCLKKLESGTTEYKYPDEWVEAYKRMQDCYGDISQKINMAEGVMRIQYGMSSYVQGKVYLLSLEKIVDAYYYYQDSNGNYIFRLSDEEDVDDNAGRGGSGEVYTGNLPQFGEYVLPIDGDNTNISITSPYGYRWGTLHKGIDFAGANGHDYAGRNLIAVADGEVTAICTNCVHNYGKSSACYNAETGERCGYIGGNYGGGSYGNWVRIKLDNGYYAWYNHMDKVSVEVGQRVKKGETIIGTGGATGFSTGPHLHFEIRNGDSWNSETYDPAEILSGLNSYFG